MKILLTGRPGIGKTTIVLKVLSACGLDAGGFTTAELRERGDRVGFSISAIGGKSGILAHVDFAGRHRVGRYGVDLAALENIGVRSIEDAIGSKELIVVDEIGKMELFSEKFAGAVLRAFESGKHVLATVMERPHPFADSLKARGDVRVIEVTRENRGRLVDEFVSLLAESAGGHRRRRRD
jgi:nucleoside-triphosphatase